jgi:hypothetical protein
VCSAGTVASHSHTHHDRHVAKIALIPMIACRAKPISAAVNQSTPRSFCPRLGASALVLVRSPGLGVQPFAVGFLLRHRGFVRNREDYRPRDAPVPCAHLCPA